MADTILFITGNDDKFREAKEHVDRLEKRELDIEEVQSMDAAHVVKRKLEAAMQTIKQPCIVEDTSLALDDLGGLPGPLIKHFLAAIGPEGLARHAPESNAVATCAIGYFDGQQTHVITASKTGTIAPEPRGADGFGFDHVFVPKGESETWAQMGAARKQADSHRQAAFEKLAEYIGATAGKTR